MAKIKILLEQTSTMTETDAARVSGRVLERADQQTPTNFRRSVRRAVERTDPEALRKRRARAIEDRGVWLQERPDGMAEITAILPAVDAVAIYAVLDEAARQTKFDSPAREHLTEWARDPDGRTQPNRRADALTDLVLGAIGERAQASRAAQSTRGPLWRRNIKVDIRITMPFTTAAGFAEYPGYLTGYGPLSAEQSRQLAAHGTWRRLLTDPATGNPLRNRQIQTPAQPPRRRADHPQCTRPSCTIRADHSDLDHRPDGSATWTTPSGHTYEYIPESVADPVTEPVSDEPAASTAPIEENDPQL